jgi:hypothetical protein
MAMNKAEKQLEDAIDKARLYAAFQITPEITPDLPAPSSGVGFGADAHIYGYDFNEHTRKVFEAWSESVRNGTGHGERKHGSQGGRNLYSTKLLALQAMRNKIAMKSADILVGIDLMIDKELGKCNNPHS